MTPVVWQRAARGHYIGRVDSVPVVYVLRTRYGWAYGTIGLEGDYHEVEETNRPLARNKVFAERTFVEPGWTLTG